MGWWWLVVGCRCMFRTITILSSPSSSPLHHHYHHFITITPSSSPLHHHPQMAQQPRPQRGIVGGFDGIHHTSPFSFHTFPSPTLVFPSFFSHHFLLAPPPPQQVRRQGKSGSSFLPPDLFRCSLLRSPVFLVQPSSLQ